MVCLQNFTFFYHSGDVNDEHNKILETPMSRETIYRSGNEKLYKLEEANKKLAKEEKKARKRKDKKDKVPFEILILNVHGIF